MGSTWQREGLGDRESFRSNGYGDVIEFNGRGVHEGSSEEIEQCHSENC